MNNYKLLLEYDGSKYKGWQRLKAEDKTIQYKIESVLSRWLDEDIKIIGSGRTDAGVHARGQVANFWTENNCSVKEVFKALNEYLPDDIACTKVEKVDERFHSRYNAILKEYEYTIQIGNYKDPFLRQYAWYIAEKLDVSAMEDAASYLVGTHDFTSYTNLKNKKKSKTRTIESISITKSNNTLVIKYIGDGFLQHMIRIITGALIQVGLNELKSDDLLKILNNKKRDERCPLAPSKGLSLNKVDY